MAQPRRGEVWLADLGLAVQPGAFNRQGMLAVPTAKFFRQLGTLDTIQMRQIEAALKRWLGM